MATSSSDTAFITIEKSFNYRGAREHYVNVYHLDQVPPTSADWQSLGGAIWAREQFYFPVDTQVEKYYGHTPGTPPVLVFTYDVPPAGEGGTTGAFAPTGTQYRCPGDAAVWLRWGTTQKTSLGKPIYLRNYYHACYWESTPDTLVATQRNALQTLGTDFQAGIVVNGVSYRRAGPRGAVAQNHTASTYVTTRTLKHRGRRHRVTQQQILDYIKQHGVGDAPVLVP